ncbi:MAG TPA: hypothetical protein VNS63_02155, partial [Blastocatellia bacterium]|nr:hypothetical protein [Blastocatellia bacterium]
MQTCIEKAAAKSKTEFNGAGGLLTYISFTPAKARSDDMSDRNQWISYSHWGMFLTGTKHSKKHRYRSIGEKTMRSILALSLLVTLCASANA